MPAPAPSVGYAYTWPTYVDESATEEGFYYKTRTPIGSGAYTTSHTQGPSSGIGTTLASVTTYHAYNTQFDGLAVAYDSVLGESSVTYAPFQFWTAPSASAPVLTATVASSTQIDLAWTFTPNPSNGGFIIYRDEVEIARVVANIRAYTNTGLTPSTTYAYTVRPYNSNPAISGVARVDSLGTISNSDSEATSAAPVVTLGWEAVVSIASVGDSVVSTQGTLIEAKNLGSGDTYTVNGVVFVGQTTRDDLSNYFSNAAVYADGVVSADFDSMLDSFAHSATDDGFNMTGLVIGQTYLFQAFCADQRSWVGDRFSTINILSYTTPSTNGKTAGYSAKCYFTASATSHYVNIAGLAYMNAFQIRRIS
jgi:hypothetical protein